MEALLCEGTTATHHHDGKTRERSPPNVALVEIVQARDYDFSKAVIAGSRRYLVFVLTDSGEMGLTDLGDRKL